jgi:type II secretory pathway component GspD/PulD (secretin)
MPISGNVFIASKRTEEQNAKEMGTTMKTCTIHPRIRSARRIGLRIIVALTAAGSLRAAPDDPVYMFARVPDLSAREAYRESPAAGQEPGAEEAEEAEEPRSTAADEQGGESDPSTATQAPRQPLMGVTTRGDTVVIQPTFAGDAARTNLVSISLDDVPIMDVIRMFSRISGANIVAGSELEGNVTVSMRDVEWRAALRVILDSVGLVLIEKDAGIYTIIGKDMLAAEPVETDSYKLKFLTVSDIFPVVQQMLVHTNASVAAAPGNTVIIKETVDRIAKIKTMIEVIDQPRPQVFIEAKFVELNDQAIKDLGINWQVLQGYTVGAGNLQWSLTDERQTVTETEDTLQRFDRRQNTDALNELYDVNANQYEERETTFVEQPPESGNFIASTELVPTRQVTDVIDQGQNVERNVRDQTTRAVTDIRTAVLTADQFALTLSALKQNDGIDIVSNPKIIVASGETASIHVGRKDPEIKAVADNNLGGRLTYQREGWIESGVRLEVTPIVNTEDIITMLISPQLSRVIGFAESGDVRVRIPILSTREIVSQFNLPSGQTAAIGGLTETREQENVRKIPLLGDIPILGRYLFSHTHTEKV